MMTVKLFSLASLLTLCFFAQAETLKSQDKKEWPLVKVNEWKVSESCLKSCLALKPVKPQVVKQESKSKFLEHPAASFCESQKGKYVTAQYQNGDEDGLCVFEDGSYILGWDYYQKNQPKGKK